MQGLLAISALTWKAAFRFRLFIVVAVLLLASVVGLPLLVKDDGTARGFTQILLTYTLTTITALLGLSTLWLACGTLARDIEEAQIQMVAVKPIARWQIWLGKWLGLMSLNTVLLAIAGLSVYVLLQYRAGHLPPEQQAILRNEVLVSRGSAREVDLTNEINQETERILKERLAKTPVGAVDIPEVRRQIREQIKAEYQIVQPGYMRQWEIDLGRAAAGLKDKPLFLRVRFNAADKSPSGTFAALFQVGIPEKTPVWRSNPLSLAPDTFHEVQIPPGLISDEGILSIVYMNMNETTLLFPLDDGMEVLYPEASFGVNFARGLGILLCWMALLTTLGLSAASLLSFPVAAFVSVGVLAMSLSTGTMANAVEDGTVMGSNPETGKRGYSSIDAVAIPVFKGALAVINLAKDFSPVDSLSSGRSISWAQLGRAFLQIVVMLGGLIAAIGIWIFERRELATAEGIH